MGKRSYRIVSNKFLRNAGMVLLGLLGAFLVVELTYFTFFHKGSQWLHDPAFEKTAERLMFRGMHLFGTVFFFNIPGIIKFVISTLSFFTITAWVHRSMRNLRGMGIHSHLEPNWVVASWIIAPLLILTFPMSVRDVINKNCHIYDLLGRKPEIKMPGKGSYQRLFTHWWYSFWLTHFFLIVGVNQIMAQISFQALGFPTLTLWLYLLTTLVLVLLPIVLGIRFLYRFGAVEEAVMEIGDSGALEYWRDQKLQSGQIHADKSGAPEWYINKENLSMEMPEDHVFRDQKNQQRPEIGPA